MPLLSLEAIQALVSDKKSFSAGKQLAKPGSWRRLGREGDALWGVAIGSDGSTYAVHVTGAEGLHCSCPSRKRPCKHTLGLLILDAEGHAFEREALPAGHRYA